MEIKIRESAQKESRGKQKKKNTHIAEEKLNSKKHPRCIV